MISQHCFRKWFGDKSLTQLMVAQNSEPSMRYFHQCVKMFIKMECCGCYISLE